MDCLWGFGEASTSRLYTPHRSFNSSASASVLPPTSSPRLSIIFPRIQVEFAVVGDAYLQTPRAFGCQELVRLCPFEYLPQALSRSFQDYNLKYYMELR